VIRPIGEYLALSKQQRAARFYSIFVVAKGVQISKFLMLGVPGRIVRAEPTKPAEFEMANLPKRSSRLCRAFSDAHLWLKNAQSSSNDFLVMLEFNWHPACGGLG
jgi:hypothetical protein